jgi:NAD-reducing hydrogenase large subunit
MSRTLTIDPLTRLEGHAKVTIHLDDEGQVADARLHITQFRGFEKLCQGRPFTEMPGITARICGICPVAHLIASAKACDELLAVQIPETAANLRRILNLAQVLQSHALSFFYLSSPDLVLGMDADPEVRNLAGVLQSDPRLARDGVHLRKVGQTIIELLGGRRIHPAWVVPGGVSEPLDPARREAIRALLPEALARARRVLDWYQSAFEAYDDEIRTFGNFPSLFLGLVQPVGQRQGQLSFYDGGLRFVDASGQILADQVDPRTYADWIGEAVEPWSYLKFPYYKPAGYPEGMYRVGPLARLNIIDRVGTPLADQAWAEFRALHRGAVLSSFHYHYARLVEIVYCLERIEELLDDPAILDRQVRARASPNRPEGIGVAEAPRGTLIHHYRIDEDGRVLWANLIIATGHNNLAMNASVRQVARHYIRGEQIPEGMLNRVEAVVRAYDPCLSCSTHALGQMPLHLELWSADGRLLDEKRRG